jgi:chromosome segregation ATPase
MQRKFPFFSLGAIVLLIVSLMISSSKVERLENEVTVLHSQAASRAEIIILEKDIRELREKVYTNDFKNTMFSTRITALEARKDEVTVEDMKQFASNLDDVLNNFNDRIKNLETDQAKRKF